MYKFAAYGNRTSISRFEPGDNTQKRCLAGAAFADDRNEFARSDAQVESVENRMNPTVDHERLGQIPDFKALTARFISVHDIACVTFERC